MVQLAAINANLLHNDPVINPVRVLRCTPEAGCSFEEIVRAQEVCDNTFGWATVVKERHDPSHNEDTLNVSTSVTTVTLHFTPEREQTVWKRHP